MRSILLIPDLIGETSIAEWRKAGQVIGNSDWNVDIVPMPGRNGEPQPLGGEYDGVTPGYAVADLLAGRPGDRWDIVIGVAVSGWAANIVVFGGHADALVLIDGLGQPWLTVAERSSLRRRRMRAIEADPEALAHHRGGQGGRRDPRLAHGVRPLGSQSMAIRVAAATTVPTLIVATAGRISDPAVVSAYPQAATSSVSTVDPTQMLTSIVDWWSATVELGN